MPNRSQAGCLGPRSRGSARTRPLLLALCLFPWTLAGLARAETLELSPEETQIRFELDSTLHVVEGTARLVSGEIRFTPTGGATAGSVVVDARSIETGNGMRDSAMHSKVLESERYPQIELLPETLEVGAPVNGASEVVLSGITRIHGGEWPLTIRAQVTRDGDEVHLLGHFVIPYIEWGMHDMSNFLLSVGKEIRVDFEATAHILPETAAIETTPPDRPTSAAARG